MAEEATGAEHVLEHGTARVQKARGEGGKGKDGGKGGGKGSPAEKAKMKRLREIAVSKAHTDGSHTMTHRHEPPHHMPEHDETYTAPDLQAAHDHLEEHMGQANPGEAEADAGSEAGAAPAGAGAGAGGGAAEAAMEQAGGGEEAEA